MIMKPLLQRSSRCPEPGRRGTEDEEMGNQDPAIDSSLVLCRKRDGGCGFLQSNLASSLAAGNSLMLLSEPLWDGIYFCSRL